MTDLTHKSIQELEARLHELINETADIRAELHSRTQGPNLNMDQINAEALDVFRSTGLASAMRKYRQHTGCGLREAHDALQNLIYKSQK